MVGITEASAAFSGLKTAYEIAKGLYSLHTSTEVKQAIADLLDKLVDARNEAFDSMETRSALSKRVDDLEQEIVRLKAWDDEKQRYELKRYNPGSLAYTLKPALVGVEPLHHLCANCYGQGKKSILQSTGELRMRYRVHVCPSCRTEIVLGAESTPQTPAASDDAEMAISGEALRSA